MRKCGDCKECCTALAVQEMGINKPRGVTCEHVCAEGCAIYNAKPKACNEYRCDWLRNPAMPAHMQPSKSGVIFSTTVLPGGVPGLMVFETKPNVLRDNKEIQYQINRATKYMPVFFIYPSQAHILTSKRFEKAARAFARQNDESDAVVTVFDERPSLPGLPG